MDFSSHFVARNWLFNIKNTNRKRMIDITKIFPKIENGFDAVDTSLKNGNDLIEAIHIMQTYVDWPKEQRFHKKRMKDFISKFETNLEQTE